MFITKKYLSRRTLLRSASAALALPFLESMVPAQTPMAKTAANAAPRFLGIFSPHGWPPTFWADRRFTERPATEGYNVGLGYMHKPLAPFQDQLTIYAGLDSTSAMPPPGMSGGDHARASRVSDGRAPEIHRRPRHLVRHQYRPVDRPEARSGDGDAVHADRYRGSGFGDGCVRVGIQLCLFELHFVGCSQQAAAA